MPSRHHPIHCIVPPHMLKAMANQKDAKVRELAIRTIMAGAMLRGRRQILGQMTFTGHSAGKQRTIYDANHQSQLPGQLKRNETGPAAGDDVVNEAFDGLGATYDLYRDVFQRDSIDGQGLLLVASVHFGQAYANAFWDGKQMVFGDGDGTVFLGFTGALDVIGHELTHGVTQYTANLEYHDQSGALNESFSDVFGSLVKQYHAGEDAESADWLIGEGILGPSIHGVALRSMKDPGSAYDDPKLGGADPQPDHMDNYQKLPDDEFGDFGGVHINSGIPNKAFFLTASQIGGNAWDDAGHIWYETLVHRLGPTSQFQDCAEATFQVAGELFGTTSKQQQAVKEAWAEVGLTVPARAAKLPRAKRPAHAVEGNGVALKRQLARVVAELQKTMEVLS